MVLLVETKTESSASVKNRIGNCLCALYCDSILTVKPLGKYTTFHDDCPAAIGLLLILSPKLGKVNSFVLASKFLKR